RRVDATDHHHRPVPDETVAHGGHPHVHVGHLVPHDVVHLVVHAGVQAEEHRQVDHEEGLLHAAGVAVHEVAALVDVGLVHGVLELDEEARAGGQRTG